MLNKLIWRTSHCSLWKFSQLYLLLNHLCSYDVIVYSQELNTYYFLEVGRWVTFHESSWWEHFPEGKHCLFTTGLFEKEKKKETVYIYPLQFNRKFSLQSGSGLKCQHGQEDMLDLITASSTVLFIEDVIASTCRNLRQT